MYDELVLILYPLKDLVEARSDALPQLFNLLQSGTNYTDWMELGGTGTLEVDHQTLRLSVTAPILAHLDIYRVLEEIRRAEASAQY